MKKPFLLIPLSFWSIASILCAQDGHSTPQGVLAGRKPLAASTPSSEPASPKTQESTARSFHSTVIKMSQPAVSGQVNTAPVYYPPAYGQMDWISQSPPPAANVPPPDNAPAPAPQEVSAPVEAVPTPTPASAVKVVHHHPYTPGYVRKRLQKIGVKTSPGYITNRKEIVATDRKHSTVRLPKKGMDGKALGAQAISPRHFNDDKVRGWMGKAGDPVFLKKVTVLSNTETKANRYYWHQLGGLTYCHTVDALGFHWYGWYDAQDFFWTRFYAGRWWFYDPDYDRWCFWHDGFWWWQDPYHVGDLYCFTNDAYISCNSANDTIQVAAEDPSGAVQYFSPDKSRVIKVVGNAQDAFLYDASPSASFGPIYLASGVKGVEYSGLQPGKPLQVILKIADGSFDMFDGDGNPYNSGDGEQEPAALGKAGS